MHSLVEVKKHQNIRAKPETLLHGGNGNQDGKDVHKVGWVMTLMTMITSRCQVELAVSGGQIRKDASGMVFSGLSVDLHT